MDEEVCASHECNICSSKEVWMTPQKCPTIYDGPERRKKTEDRRQSDECLYHEAHEVRFAQGEAKARVICHNVDVLKEIIDTKVPSRLFYATAGGVFFLIVTILGVQWVTYKEVNNMAISHAIAMGTINTEVAEVKAEVKHGNAINNQARTSIKDALSVQTRSQNEKMTSIQKQIEQLHSYKNGEKKQ